MSDKKRRPGRYPDEVRERAVRMVFDHQAEYPSQWKAIESTAAPSRQHGRDLHVRGPRPALLFWLTSSASRDRSDQPPKRTSKVKLSTTHQDPRHTLDRTDRDIYHHWNAATQQFLVDSESQPDLLDSEPT
jgi:transposase